MTRQLLTTHEVAATLGVSVRRVQQLARSRRTGRKLGRDLLFTAAELEALRLKDRPGPKPRKERRHA